MSRTAPRFFALLLVGLGAAFAASAQSDDAARGLALWNDTPGESGVTTLTNSCSNCHDVQGRRTAIGGSSFADISFDTAMTRFALAVQNNTGGSMGQFQQLELQDARDIATYIADTPKTTASTLDFTATAVNTATTAQTVDLRHSVVPVGNAGLVVTGVALGGANAAQFTLSSNSCNGTTLAANNFCRVGISFSSPDTAGKSATLTFSLSQGSVNFSRSVALTGAVGVSSPPPTGDSGGGALGIGWLAALATALLALAATRRRGSGRAMRA